MIDTVGPVASIWQVTGQQDTAPWHAEGSCILSHSSISNLQSWCAVQTGCKGAVLASAVAYLVLGGQLVFVGLAIAPESL
jgi:hypothetical protein